MVVDKLERRDYQVDDLEARVTYWNYFYANASCWGYEKDSVMWWSRDKIKKSLDTAFGTHGLTNKLANPLIKKINFLL